MRTAAVILFVLPLFSCAESPGALPFPQHPVHTLRGHTADVMDVAFTPDGTLLATASVDGTVRLWRVDDGGLVGTLSHPEGITSMALSPDGRLLVTGSYDRAARI